MKKATKAAVVLTPEETAKNLSQKIKDIRAKVADLKKELKAVEPQLIDYMKSNKVDFFAGFKLSYTTGTLTWTGKKNKELKMALEELLKSLPKEYIVEELDKDKIFAAMKTDNALLGALTKAGVSLTQNAATNSLKSDKSDDSE